MTWTAFGCAVTQTPSTADPDPSRGLTIARLCVGLSFLSPAFAGSDNVPFPSSCFAGSDNGPFPSSCWPMGALTTVTLLDFCWPCHGGGVAASKGSDMVVWSPLLSKNPAPACLAIHLKHTSQMLGGTARPVASAVKSSMLTPRASALSEHRGRKWFNWSHNVTIPLVIYSICSDSRLSMLSGQDAGLSFDPTWSNISFQIWDGLTFGV